MSGTMLGHAPVTLVDASPASADDWAAAIEADPHALPEQSPEWMSAIVESSGARDVSRAYRFVDGSSVVLPLIRTGVAGAGSIWSPPPAWGVGGIVGPAVDAVKVGNVVTDLRALRALRVMVRIDVRHEDHWQTALQPGDLQIPRRSHVIQLHEDPASHFSSLSRRTRKMIKDCEGDGLRIVEDRTGALLPTHYELFLKSVARWAGKQHEPVALAMFRARRRDPIAKLRAMQRSLGERFVTLVAYVDDRPAASAIVLLGKTTRYTRGAMDIDLAGPSNASVALQWQAVQAAYTFGSKRYHMGESGNSAGIAEFKQRFGAEPFDHHEYRFEHLPITRTGDLARSAVKRVIGFRDT